VVEAAHDMKAIQGREAEPIARFLAGSGLEMLAPKLIESGYERVVDVKALTQDDLKEIGVAPGHIKRLIIHIKRHATPVRYVGEASTGTPHSSRFVGDSVVSGFERSKLFAGLQSMSLLEATERALEKIKEGYMACLSCDTVLKVEDTKKQKHIDYHEKYAEKYPPAKYVALTGRWYVETAQGFSPDLPAVGMYTMEGPICYEVNTSMRLFAQHGDSTRYKDTRFFCQLLAKELEAIPPLKGKTLYRSMRFSVDYPQGSIQTLPQPTSTTIDVQEMKKFLGEDQGSILMFKTCQGRPIRPYSRYPEEEEILIPAGVSFQVEVPGKEIEDFINSAMGKSYRIKVVVMKEISDKEAAQRLAA